MVNAQEWLEKEYNTREKRIDIKELHIDNRSLEGELDLSDFINLERLICLENKLTKIIVSPSAKNKLTYLDISNNNFPEQDLSFLTDYVNLEFLSLGNDKDQEIRIEKDVYNRFTGSLEPLKNMKNLKILWINNTDLDSGSEYLPNGLRRIYCENNSKKESKVGEIQKLFFTDKIRNNDNFYKTNNLLFTDNYWKKTSKWLWGKKEEYYYYDYQVWLKEKQEMEEAVKKLLEDVVDSGLSETSANHTTFQLEAKNKSLEKIEKNVSSICEGKNTRRQKYMLLVVKRLVETGDYKVSWICQGTKKGYASDEHNKEVLEELVNKFEAFITSQESVQQQLTAQIQVAE